ncbi:MAG TPA: LysR family transcriptional regulator [Planctomicrobium sp.]|nr:LysR family transcriptional regulator [Planctomicrobium sp.]
MTSPASRTVIYKDLSYSQLRSYCETARQGSMTAAAKALDVSHPTVWKQIRSIEQLLGETLVDSDGRRSELTLAGKILAEIASPLVAEFESLQQRFHEAYGSALKSLTVAAPPRSYTDDMMGVIGEFHQIHPDIKLRMREVFESLGNELLEAGEVDLVIGDRKACRRPDELMVEKLYEIEPMIIMPVGHPLSKKKRITVEDLAKYPFLNHPDFYPDEEGRAILQKAGVFEHPDRGFDLVLASSIRSCVKQGHGIGLVGQVRTDHPRDPALVERSIQHLLPPAICYGFSVRRVAESPTQRAFMDLVKQRLGREPLK